MMPYASTTPPGTPPTAPRGGVPQQSGLPDFVVMMGGLVLIGGIAEVLYNADRRAGWTFTLIVLLGFLAAGDRITVVIDKFREWGIVK